MHPDALELIEELLRRRYFGKYRGKVLDNDDTSKLGRIKVKVDGIVEGDGLWAWPCVPYAGPRVGFYCLPPKEALVWVEFEGGDPSFPIWTGCLWAKGELPQQASSVDTRLLRTDKAHMVFDDSAGEVLVKNDQDASVKLGADIKSEAGQATHTVGSSGVVSESSSGKVEVAAAGVTINNGAFKVS
jgi:uncharacterized protein involved in type VI secretion and phage assembly